jgi:hypothetical protein
MSPKRFFMSMRWIMIFIHYSTAVYTCILTGAFIESVLNTPVYTAVPLFGHGAFLPTYRVIMIGTVLEYRATAVCISVLGHTPQITLDLQL